ncbi:MAG: DNA repair protein RecO [Phascolarctobacterium sp.]|nr:DNA repair protein RecO [Phascolarctobacterium sp.]
MSGEVITDDAIILRVRDQGDKDKYVICYTKKHGKVRFTAFGGRSTNNVKGRVLQTFSELELELVEAGHFYRFRNAQFINLPYGYDLKQMAYASVVAELIALLTEDHQPQEELYDLLRKTLKVLSQRNPRLVVLAFAIKLLALSGLAPQIDSCVSCSALIEPDEDAYFSPLQGGLICKECKTEFTGQGLADSSAAARKLWHTLEQLDFENPRHFTVRGQALMEVERMLYKFIYFQTDKNLQSLEFLQQLGI